MRDRRLFVLHGLLEGDPAKAGVETPPEGEATPPVDDFEAKYGLSDEDEGDGGPPPAAAESAAPPPASPAAAPDAQPASPQPPTTSEPKGETPPAPPAAAPAEAPSVQPQPAAQPPKAEESPPPSGTPTALSEEQQLTRLTEYYKLSDEDAAALQTEQETVFPKLAAKLHYSVMQDLGAWVAQAVPQMIQRYNDMVRLEEQAQARIFARWPELKEYKEQTLQAGALFRQMNPNATPEQVLEAIGPIVFAGLGRPMPTTPAAAQAPQAQAPATFMPAAPAAAPAPAPSAPAVDSIQALIDDDLAEGYRPAGR